MKQGQIWWGHTAGALPLRGRLTLWGNRGSYSCALVFNMSKMYSRDLGARPWFSRHSLSFAPMLRTTSVLLTFSGGRPELSSVSQYTLTNSSHLTKSAALSRACRSFLLSYSDIKKNTKTTAGRKKIFFYPFRCHWRDFVFFSKNKKKGDEAVYEEKGHHRAEEIDLF